MTTTPLVAVLLNTLFQLALCVVCGYEIVTCYQNNTKQYKFAIVKQVLLYF